MKELLNYTLPLQSSLEHSDCLQASVNTVIYNIGKNHNLLPFLTFSNFKICNDQLSFCFERNDTIKGIPDNLADLTGVLGYKYELDSKSDLFDQCLYNTQNQIPTIINIDTFNLPYHIGYRKLHYGHYFIILSTDSTGHCIYMDPFFQFNRVEIEFDDLPILYHHYFIFKKDASCIKPVHSIIKKQIDDYARKDFCKNVEKVCHLLLSGDKLKNELQDYNKYKITVLAPFLLKLKCFITERRNLLYCLYQYFFEEQKIINSFESCVKNSNDSYMVFLKSAARDFRKDLIEKGAQLMIKAIQQEEEVMANISSIMDKKSIFN